MAVHDFQYGGATVLSSPLVVEVLLPFLLVFTVVFAVLQKSQVLGKDKKQIDAIVAFVIGLILISFANAVGIIIQLIVVLAVSLVVILVFLLLWGFFFSAGEFKIKDWVKWTAGGVAALVVVVAVLIVSGGWDYVYDMFSNGTNSMLIMNIVVILVIVVAIAVVLGFSGKKAE